MGGIQGDGLGRQLDADEGPKWQLARHSGRNPDRFKLVGKNESWGSEARYPDLGTGRVHIFGPQGPVVSGICDEGRPLSPENKFHHGDETGRTLRKIQEEVLTWLDEHWDDYDVFLIPASTGAGKSMIARAVQLATNALIITPTNQLLAQYKKTYKSLTTFIGRDNYPPTKHCVRCSDEPMYKSIQICGSCLYKRDKLLHNDGSSHVATNPFALWYARSSKNPAMQFEPRDVFVVDEAHMVASSISEIVTQRFAQSRFKWPEDCVEDIPKMINWLEIIATKFETRLEQELEAGEIKTAARLEKELGKIRGVLVVMYEAPETMIVGVEEGTTRGGKISKTLVFTPVDIPPTICRKLFAKAQKVIMLSATMLPHEASILSGDPTSRIAVLGDLEWPIPVENRRIYWEPISEPANYKTPPEVWVEKIAQVVKSFPLGRTLIHCTYSDGELWKPLLQREFPDRAVIHHTKSEKDEMLAYYRKIPNTILLASGMSEGLDLSDDQCRLCIVPKMYFPYLGDAKVARQLQLGNQHWYSWQTLRHLIQAVGRGVRHKYDWCFTVVLDPRFPRIFSKAERLGFKEFCRSIVWEQSIENEVKVYENIADKEKGLTIEGGESL